MNRTEPDNYQTILDPVSGSFRDRGSKFLGFAYPVTSEEQIREHLTLIKKHYHDAHHHCYAWALGPDRSLYRINDDGEPSGSAGKPIYGQMLSRNLSDLLVVVVRYFGGTKLGIPGLINAYRTAAAEALSQAEIVTKTVTSAFRIRCAYALLQQVMHIIKDKNLILTENHFEEDCLLIVHVPKSQTVELFAKFNSIHGVNISVVNS
ncbi:MAG TPA: YigZ family protein [Bacteroidales bacterium]|nr:YigZ family protein [Bacteroidales bacterium]HNS45937.1 YigZ family protein [Bacteroidales bacterium]